MDTYEDNLVIDLLRVTGVFQHYSELFSIRHPEAFFIGGEWVKPKGSQRFDIVYPATEAVVGSCPAASIADVDRAVAAAREAFDNGPWPRMTFDERADVLQRASEIMMSRSAAFGDAWTVQIGCAKSLSGPGGFAPGSIFAYYADMVRGRTFESVRPLSRREGVGIVVKEAVGVVAAITPWNAPSSLPCKIIAPALANGCSVIHKPAPETPLDAWLLAECLEEAGVPPGVFNFVPADRDVGDHLVRHNDVEKVALIGSVAAGKHIASVVGARLGRCSLELGGKSPAIILDDIEPADVIERLVPHFTMNAGQMCAGLTRIIVPEASHDKWADAIAAALEAMNVGDPMDPATWFGPIAMKRQYERVMSYMDIGRAEGANVITGGGRPANLNSGYFVAPTLFSGTNDMRVARDEIFGPVATLITHKGVDDAVRMANDTEFGLNGAVYTNDADLAYKVSRQVRAGNMTHNDWINDVQFPFGGFKNSGIGRDGGPEGLALFQETKVVFMDAVPPSVHPVA
jgi:acyl-CoA reductase-like NAD-dependent aldehyde dehydrogenase